MFPTLARLAAVAVVLAACNGSDAAVPDPSPTLTAAVTATPTAAPSPEPSPTEVLPANDVADPVEALEAIVQYYDRLFSNPDPEKLSLIYAERCDCYDEVIDELADMSESGERLRFDRVRTFELVEVERREGPFAQIRYQEDSPGVELLSRSGEVLERDDEDVELYSVTALLVKEGGRWRVVAYA